MRISALCAVLATTLLLTADEPENRGVSRILPASPAEPTLLADDTFAWRPALSQSMRFLFIEHGFRLLMQPGTRGRLSGPFLRDYADSVKSLRGWGDRDNWFFNYIGHPMQGAMSGYIYVQNDPRSRALEFANTSEYWSSRVRALAWNTAYSTQFEVGPLSESSIGNVGQRKGTSGYVDLVMTPVGGFVVMIAEDALDRFLVRRWESRTDSLTRRGVYRVVFNPCRSFANIMRGKSPWYRDSRPLRGH